LSAPIALLLVGSAFPANQVNAYPDTDTSPLLDLFCYVQFADQRIVDLSNLCGAATVPVRREVVVTAIRVSGNNVVGEVRNDTGQTLQRVIVNYEFLGQPLGADRSTDFGFVEPERLEPGQTGVFTGAASRPGDVRVTAVEWW